MLKIANTILGTFLIAQQSLAGVEAGTDLGFSVGQTVGIDAGSSLPMGIGGVAGIAALSLIIGAQLIKRKNKK
jgi:hypothetical protein